jgi:hypothetical protein
MAALSRFITVCVLGLAVAAARRAADFGAEEVVIKVRLRAERKIGEITRAMEKAPHGPGRGYT